MKKQIIRQQQQRGFILIIALILMVVMAIGALVTFRLSKVSDVVNNNVRASVQAHQAAEAALNYCRDALMGTGSLKIKDSIDGELWKDISNWTDANINKVTLALPGNPTQPQCLVENVTDYYEGKKTNSHQKVAAFKITARGFSPNFSADTKGYQQAGAQSWVQVTVVRTLG